MKTFEQFMEHHQKDATGKVVEHEDTTPSSVEEQQLVDFLTLKEYSPNVSYQAKGGKKSGKLGKSSVYSLRGKDESKKDFRKSHVKDVEGGYVGGGHKPTPGSLKKEDYYRGTGEKVQARTKKFMDKKGQKGAPGLDAMKARTAEHKAKRGVSEAKVDEKLPEYKRATARDKRYGNPHGSHALGGGIRKDRRADHEAKRGVKEEVVTELNRYGKETGKATGSINKRAGTPVKKGGSTDDKALTFVRNMIRKETGKPEGQRKKTKGEKGRVQYGDRRTTPADSIAKRRQSRADADAAMRDTRGT